MRRPDKETWYRWLLQFQASVSGWMAMAMGLGGLFLPFPPSRSIDYAFPGFGSYVVYVLLIIGGGLIMAGTYRPYGWSYGANEAGLLIVAPMFLSFSFLTSYVNGGSVFTSATGFFVVGLAGIARVATTRRFRTNLKVL